LNLGGYDTIFRRSREDSDLVQRCLHSNIELVQTFSTNVYHFTCVSSRGKDWFNKENTQAQERVRMQNIADQIELRRFIRKWGNFNHGENKLFKFNIDLSITNYTMETVYNIEPFFNKIWLNSKTAEQDVEKIVQLYEHEYDISNKLYGITDEMWEVHKTNYRLDENIKNKISVGMPSTYNVLVSIDFNKISGQNKFINSLPYLYNILAECTAGEYEVENVLISVRDLQLEPIDIKVINPRVYVDNIISY
jgi:hypothetical protein